MKLLSLFVLAAFSSLRGFASSFGVAESIDLLSKRRRSMMTSSSTTEKAASDASTTCGTEDNNMKDEKKKPDKTLVKFVASRSHSTPPMPLPSPPATLDDFFSQKEYCDLLFSAEATLTDVDNPSPELWDMLKDSNLYYRDALPDSTTTASTPIRFMELANAPMHFIGVTLHSTATVGIQYLQGPDFVKQSHHYGFPEFRFYLLSTNLEARGPPPLVWLFYKLIGKKQGEDGISTASASRFQTSGFTRVWAEAVTSQRKVVFHNTARLESRLRIPSVLLSLMPFSVQHLEEKGSESLQTAIDKDMEPAAERFQEAYTQWLISK